MIAVYSHVDNSYVAELVRYGLIRSFTCAQVTKVITDVDYLASSVYVFINPDKDSFSLLCQLVQRKVKVILFGTLSDDVAGLIGVETTEISEVLKEWAKCSPASVYGFSESEVRIQYTELPDGLQCMIDDRPLLRYDFAEEWNNHGYGAVMADGSIWSVACQASITSQFTEQLAFLYRGESDLSSYVTLSSVQQAEILWVNRAVGFIDTQECRLIETFVCNYHPEKLPCLPLLREIPYGYDAMISMRLDCDESISAALPLFELYKSENIPFSLAVKTAQETDDDDYALLNEIIEQRGAVLSHTVNHKNNWGVDKDDVRAEAAGSRRWILEHVKNAEIIEYAVSPFHQNPDYAVEALAQESYRGFISGIICNDPQYLLSRAGKVVGVKDIVTHSQQCMLHGDCLLKAGDDQLSVYKKSAEICVRSGAIFGYLDHPFSERYQYGWITESQRVDAHRDWIDYLQSMGNVLFENEAKTLSHIKRKSGVNVWLENDVVQFESKFGPLDYSLAYEFKGSIDKLC